MSNKNELNLKFTKEVSKKHYETYLVWCGIHWGRGCTLQDAIKAAKVHPSNKFEATLFKSDEPLEAWVSDGGGWSFTPKTAKAKVEVIELGIIQQAQDISIETLYEWLCSELGTKHGNIIRYQFEEKTERFISKFIDE